MPIMNINEKKTKTNINLVWYVFIIYGWHLQSPGVSANCKRAYNVNKVMKTGKKIMKQKLVKLRMNIDLYS